MTTNTQIFFVLTQASSCKHWRLEAQRTERDEKISSRMILIGRFRFFSTNRASSHIVGRQVLSYHMVPCVFVFLTCHK